MVFNSALIASLAALVVAHPSPAADANTIRLPVSDAHRYQPRDDGTVDGPAFLVNLNNTLKKYHATPLPSFGLSESVLSGLGGLLEKRATANVPLTDQVEDGVDELYYGDVTVGASKPQTFTIDFDTGSADFFVPGPQCTKAKGCVGTTKYDQDGTNEHNTTSVTYGSGSVKGNNYFDTVCVGGLCAPHTNVVSLTTASGFSTSDSEGLMGMGFSTIAESKQPTFVENLISLGKLTANEFSFFLGRARSGTGSKSELTLGGRDHSRYIGTFSAPHPVTTKGYWQITVNDVTVNGKKALTSPGQAAIDTGTTVVIAPTAASATIFTLIPGAVPVPLVSGSPTETVFAYPCDTAVKYIPKIVFGKTAYAINPLDFSLGKLTSDFAELIGSSLLSDLLDKATGSGLCLAAIIADDIDPPEELYVVGDTFLKNWYATFSYANGASVSFAKSV